MDDTTHYLALLSYIHLNKFKCGLKQINLVKTVFQQRSYTYLPSNDIF